MISILLALATVAASSLSWLAERMTRSSPQGWELVRAETHDGGRIVILLCRGEDSRVASWSRLTCSWAGLPGDLSPSLAHALDLAAIRTLGPEGVA